MEKLTVDEVLHVANLAKLKLKDDEIESYAYKLKSVMNSIEKINDVEVTSNDLMISPTTVECLLFEDCQNEVLPKSEVLKNAPKRQDSYISVRGVFNE